MNLSSAKLLAVGLVSILAAGALSAMRVGDDPAGQMLTYASAWAETLDEAQQKKALLPYDSPERTNWNFIPLPTRKGLPMFEMSKDQQASALRTVKAALSESGYAKSQLIMQFEGLLRKMEGADKAEVVERRNPEKYYMTIYGKPSATDAWGLSFEGHHLSLNFVCRDGQVVATTPQFMAANPAVVMSEQDAPFAKGTRILRDEEEFAFQIINGLSADLRKAATIDAQAPKEIRFVGQPHATPTAPEGIKIAAMDAASRDLTMKLIQVYANVLPEAIAKQRLKEIDEAGPDAIHFAWAGATQPGIGHYYRIQGPSFLIELVNVQPDAEGNPANHIHAVWRDVRGDFALPAK